VRIKRALAPAALIAGALGLAACGQSEPTSSVAAAPGTTATATTATTSTSTTTTAQLPGTGKPTVTIGDKNFTEQFVLGQLYAQALKAQGYSVVLNPNIGPTEVTLQALLSGRLAMYPEYLSIWDSTVAGYKHQFRSARAALGAGRRYGRAHGLELLRPTPFSDTGGIAVTSALATQHRLHTISDLRKLGSNLTLGGPAQFQQSPTAELPAFEQAYGLLPSAYKPLDIGSQYQALDDGSVQAAEVSTTDGQLDSANYVLLRDPLRVFGYGQAVPVVPAAVLQAEGPAFAETINRVSALLSAPAIRQMNAAVDVYNRDPMAVARSFLQANGLLTPRPA
jgi:osmoprotectant transport system substrate-binding protein